MKKILLILLIFTSTFIYSAPASADAGNYVLRFVAGPSFETSDWVDQFRFGGEFKYDLGYDLNIGLISLFGLGSSEFRYDLIPGFSYNYLYLGPAVFHLLAGAGYAAYGSDSAIDVRFSTGVELPLGTKWQAYSDINFIFAPVGTPGTPSTFDWLLGFGYVF